MALWKRLATASNPVVGLKKAQFALQQYGAMVEERLISHMKQTAIRIRDAARNYAPSDTGKLRQMIHVKGPKIRRSANRDNIRFDVKADAPYSAWVEFGGWMETRTGSKVGFKMPPSAGLAAWASRHGPQYPNAAFLIARAIGSGLDEKGMMAAKARKSRAKRRGIKKRPYMGRAYQYEKRPFYSGVYRIVGVEVPRWLEMNATKSAWGIGGTTFRGGAMRSNTSG